LKALVEDQTGGNPMTKQKWVRRSLRNLADDLRRHGHRASRMTVARLLRAERFSPKGNRKCLTGARHPDRDRQFQYLTGLKQAFLAAGLPVISVDAKKKELVGNFEQAGTCWCQEADRVNAYDFKSAAEGIAVPYGLYVVNLNQGFVEVGTSANTAQFAVDVIVDWWQGRGQQAFPGADQLLILCDSGGSNGYRPRLWKRCLQAQVVDRFGLEVTVCHYPKGASKYNPVERRLFSPISGNWQGKALRSYPLILAYIRGTKTATGLRIQARVNRKTYKTKIKVSDAEMEALNLEHHEICPRWNYTIRPTATK
jgi:Rhodopirellula transposase DDE domain